MQECKFKFREISCEEFARSAQRPDAPEFVRQFASIFCMNAPAIDVEEIVVSSNSQDVKSVVEAVNSSIRTQALALANQQGIENPAIPEYGIGDLFQKYSYRCHRVRPSWYKHTFTLK